MNAKLQKLLADAVQEQQDGNKSDRTATYDLAGLINAVDLLASQLATEAEARETNDHMVVVEGKQDAQTNHLKKLTDELPRTRQALVNVQAQLTDLEDISAKLDKLNTLAAKLDTVAAKLDQLIAK